MKLHTAGEDYLEAVLILQKSKCQIVLNLSRCGKMEETRKEVASWRMNWLA